MRRTLRSLPVFTILFFGIAAGRISTPAEDRPDASTLLKEVVAHQIKNIDARYHYRYVEQEITEDLGPDNNPRSFDTKEMMWTHTDYDSYVKYLAINGGRYSQEVINQQQAKIDQQIREAAAKPSDQRNALRAAMVKERDKEKDFIRSLPDAFDFQPAGTQTINGHSSWVFSFTPRPGFRPPSRETVFLKTLTGKIWITEEEHQLIRLSGTLGDDVDFGGGLFGKVRKGSTITLEQSPVAGGFWMPAFTEMEFRAKVFVKGENRIETSRYSHYEAVSNPAAKIEVEKLP
ncbi:MAG: hypothetical protein PHX83_10960 [Acidobacteriia bacterium]|nr:hypothetical protein [Terriglobia bacterium]